MKLAILFMMLSFVSLVQAEPVNEYTVPGEYVKFMDGYKYDYPGCSVVWSIRTSSFLVSGENCDKISAEKMRRDALKSISYVKANGSYTDFTNYYAATERVKAKYDSSDAARDAVKIWEGACIDFKNGMNAGDFRDYFKLGEVDKLYPELKRNAAIRLYSDGWNYAKDMNGVLDCSYFSDVRANAYISGVDIRKN